MDCGFVILKKMWTPAAGLPPTRGSIIIYVYIINQSEILFLISINLFLILIFMLILLSLEIVKIQNLFINQPDI